jgi:hypothetical protein
MDSASTSPPQLEDDFDQEPPDDGGEQAPPAPPFGVGTWRYAEAPEPPPRVPFVVPGDVVTRMLCSTVHLKGAFADHVLDNLVDPTHRAMAPNWNIDTPTLVRHAQQARDRRMQRDTQLLWVFLFLVVGEICAIGAVATGRISIALFGVLAIAVWLGAYAASFATVWAHYSMIHLSSIAAIGIKGADLKAEEPPPLDPEIEEVLEAADNANTILFSGASPFIGSGEVLDRWTVTVDVGTGAKRADGTREEPDRFVNSELHDALSVAIPRAIGPNPKVGNRLYVVGGHALSIGGLFRSGPVPEEGEALVRFRRPVPSVPENLIRRFMDQPHQSARPYTFFELKAWDGQVVVTLFVRVLVTYPTLFVEMAVCALRPPQGRYGEVGTIRLGPGVHRWPIFRSVLPMALRLMLGAPGRQSRLLKGKRAYRLALRDLELTLRERFDVNFSAGHSLREEIARNDNPLHFGFVDEEMFYRVFNQASMDCLRNWLVARKVDVTDFDRQAIKITEKRMTNARDIYGIDH